MKHKHSELIKAWADGAEIQYYDSVFHSGTWRDICGRDLHWHPEVKYRIKPEPIIRTLTKQAIAEYKAHWNITDSINIPIDLTHRFAELIINKHLTIWEQMDNGNAVEGYIEMEDYPKAILKSFGVEK